MWTTASRTERTTSRVDADVIVVGAGLAGLVATAEAADAGRRVLLLDQENEHNLGGQAHWSFGGLFLVDSPEQRRMGISDSLDLAWQDWQGTAGFDRLDDHDPPAGIGQLGGRDEAGEPGAHDDDVSIHAADPRRWGAPTRAVRRSRAARRPGRSGPRRPSPRTPRRPACRPLRPR